MAPRAKSPRPQPGLTWAAICRMAADLPAVETAKSGETPAIRVRKGRLLTWQRDQGSVAIKVDPIDRDRPELFEDLLVGAWRRYAPKTVVGRADGRARRR